MRTIEFNNEDIKECKLALLRQDLTSLQSAFLMKHITNLEQALNEIREYMKTLCDEYANDDYDIKCEVFEKIYQKLDKVLGGNNDK